MDYLCRGRARKNIHRAANDWSAPEPRWIDIFCQSIHHFCHLLFWRGTAYSNGTLLVTSLHGTNQKLVSLAPPLHMWDVSESDLKVRFPTIHGMFESNFDESRLFWQQNGGSPHHKAVSVVTWCRQSAVIMSQHCEAAAVSWAGVDNQPSLYQLPWADT